MICKQCEDKGHYWFAPEWEDNKNGMPKVMTKKVGIYGSCDMRQVYARGVGCQCGCHKKNKSLVNRYNPFVPLMGISVKKKKGNYRKKTKTIKRRK
jgi:hypothetical protein